MVLPARGGIWGKAKAMQCANHFPIDRNGACVIHLNIQQGRIMANRFHQHRCAPINKAFGEFLVERVRQFQLQRARLFGPMRRVLQPICAMRDIGPGPHRGNARCHGFHIALNAIEPSQFLREPRRGNGAIAVA